jgi:N-methylhydantoinase A
LLEKGNNIDLFEDNGKEDPRPFDARSVYLKNKGFGDVLVYERADMRTGFSSVGPAIIEQMDTTIFIEEGDRFVFEKGGNIIITWH